MRWFIRLLPLFVVVWLARRCEIVNIHDSEWYVAFEDVLVRKES